MDKDDVGRTSTPAAKATTGGITSGCEQYMEPLFTESEQRKE